MREPLTPERLAEIRADIDRRVPATDLRDRDHVRALLAEVERLTDANLALHGRVDADVVIVNAAIADRNAAHARLAAVEALVDAAPAVPVHVGGGNLVYHRRMVAVDDIRAALRGTPTPASGPVRLYRRGDDDPTGEGDGPACEEDVAGYLCTWPVGHDHPQHIAADGGGVVLAVSPDPTPDPERTER